MNRYDWRSYGRDWTLVVPRKGTGQIYNYSSGADNKRYWWFVNILSCPPRSDIAPIASGREDTFDEARRQVEETFDMIEEY